MIPESAMPTPGAWASVQGGSERVLPTDSHCARSAGPQDLGAPAATKEHLTASTTSAGVQTLRTGSVSSPAPTGHRGWPWLLTVAIPTLQGPVTNKSQDVSLGQGDLGGFQNENWLDTEERHHDLEAK